MFPLKPLIADTLDAGVRYGSSRLQSFTEWWHLPLLIAAGLLVAAFVIYMYRRDSVELKPGVGVLLMFLRLTALAGLLLFFLGIERRSERRVVHNSRALLLVDTSMSMTRQDADAAASGTAGSRIQQIVDELSQGELLTNLRNVHEVSVWRFDKELGQVVSLGKLPDATTDEIAAERAAVAPPAIDSESFQWARAVVYVAAGIGAVALAIFFARWFSAGSVTHGIPWLATAGLASIVALVSLAYMNLSEPRLSVLALLGLSDGTRTEEPVSATPAPQTVRDAMTEQRNVRWSESLNADGTETRLGESLSQLLNDQRGTPVAGIVVYSDGGQNAGVGVQKAIELAREAKIPIHTVGLGSDDAPKNVRVSDFAVPARVYPGDGFQVTGYIQGEGFANRRVTVELMTRPADKPGAVPTAGNVAASQSVTLAGDGEPVPVRFEMSGISEIGRRTLRMQIRAPQEDTDRTDDAQEHDVEIVDRKNRILLLAGGPSREYQFLRNQLRRDRGTVVDVLLQTGAEGISQDANEILQDFPRTKEALYVYDCVVAFDPDWQAFDTQQIDNLERWVAEQAGGLVCIAGPIYMDQWTQDRRLVKVRGLYPVEFSNRLAVAVEGRFKNRDPAKVEFTREGTEAPYLWLGDTPVASQQAWESFSGVYGHYGVQGGKPGATVLAYFADDANARGSQRPIYMAEHFYGAGRVLYVGSGEMWRLRSIGEGYFEQLYTKLLRHVSQGRLMRGSARGVLLVERERLSVGSTLAIRAQLNNARMEPLDHPRVSLQIIYQKKNHVQSIALMPDPIRKGMYSGQFTPREEGTYRLELDMPESAEEQLVKTIRAELTGVEGRNSPRNSKLLKEVSLGTKGEYYPGIAATHDGSGSSLAKQLRDRTEVTMLAGDKDQDWDRVWMSWLLMGICGVLCLEWLVRRLSRLA